MGTRIDEMEHNINDLMTAVRIAKYSVFRKNCDPIQKTLSANFRPVLAR